MSAADHFADRLKAALELLVKETGEARRHARIAYEFGPNSYTFSAMSQPSRALDEAAALLEEIKEADESWT